MKRFFFGGFIALCGLIISATPVLAANTDNFRITNYDVHMELGRDEDKTSTLRTTLTITADFPPNQNRGIAPIFVKTYDKHSTSFTLESVTDEQGAALEYHWDGDELRIGNADVYVSGLKTYVITYTQRNVTRYYADTNKDEFYWDAIGTEWRVPIEQARVSLSLSPDLAELNPTELQCYAGAFHSSASCGEVAEGAGSYTVQLTNIGNGQGATLAIGFEAGTFAEYQPTLMERVVGWIVLANILSIIPVALIGIFLLIAHRKKAITPEIKNVLDRAVVPRYTPPDEFCVIDSCQVLYSGMRSRALSGQIIDWAVRHYVVLKQTSEKKLTSKAQYDIEMIREIPRESRLWLMLVEVFDGLPKLGSVTKTEDIAKRSVGVSSMFRYQSVQIVDHSGLYSESSEASEFAKKTAKTLAIIGLMTLTITTLAVAWILFLQRNNTFLSLKGQELKKHLEGLKMYIEVAEVERLKMLQAPETVEKVGNVADDKGARIKLYEKVLPYAILFGQEKQWAKQLGDLYVEAGQSPDWNQSLAGFSVATFTSSISSFTADMSSASSYSSSSGGSSGGGFSGGGGGGGGGGGW